MTDLHAVVIEGVGVWGEMATSTGIRDEWLRDISSLTHLVKQDLEGEIGQHGNIQLAFSGGVMGPDFLADSLVLVFESAIVIGGRYGFGKRK